MFFLMRSSMMCSTLLKTNPIFLMPTHWRNGRRQKAAASSPPLRIDRGGGTEYLEYLGEYIQDYRNAMPRTVNPVR